MTDGSPLGPILRVGNARVLAGTCSWADATLVKETDWYPKRSMRAAERLAHYAARFPLVEVDSTYYFPPTPELAASWASRTPEGFTMNVKAWSLFTGHPTFPHSLWPDLQHAVRPDLRDRPRLYAGHLPEEVLEECWERFRHALMPLHSAGKLGAVLLQYPPWFTPRESNRDLIVKARHRLPDYDLCVEFRNGRWLDGGECDATLEFLEAHDLSFVCVDEPQGFPSSVPPVVAVTNDLAVVRFSGRNAETWEQKYISAAERFAYHYRPDELAEWLPKVTELARTATGVHLLMNNCYRDYAVDNAATLVRMLEDEVGAVRIAG